MHRTVFALSLLLGACTLAIATPAHAVKPDLEKCHYETKCHMVTPQCHQGGGPAGRPCKPPFQVCNKEKICGD
jgi:hypothetical protein